MELSIGVMRTVAHENSLEFIVDRDGDICIRPMHFINGTREVRHYPDPCDFVSPERATKILESCVHNPKEPYHAEFHL